MPTAIDVSTNGLIEVLANSRKSLGKFRCCDAIARNPLMINALELLNLAWLQTLEVTMNRFDRR